jgi:hypothetical protein
MILSLKSLRVFLTIYLKWVQVRLVQQNGEVLEKPLLHVLLIDKTRMKLFKGRTTKAREEYTSIIQVSILQSDNPFSHVSSDQSSEFNT